MIVGVDVDEVCAALHDPWIEWYNQNYAEPCGYPRLKFGDFTRWAIHELVPIGAEVYRFLKPEVYDDDRVKPIPFVQHGLNILREEAGLRVFFVSSCGADHYGKMADAKLRWLKRHGFFTNRDVFVSSRNKFRDVGDIVSILIDDGYHNVAPFGPRRAVLVTRPWNQDMPWVGPRAYNLYEAADRAWEMSFQLMESHRLPV